MYLFHIYSKSKLNKFGTLRLHVNFKYISFASILIAKVGTKKVDFEPYSYELSTIQHSQLGPIGLD